MIKSDPLEDSGFVEEMMEFQEHNLIFFSDGGCLVQPPTIYCIGVLMFFLFCGGDQFSVWFPFWASSEG